MTKLKSLPPTIKRTIRFVLIVMILAGCIPATATQAPSSTASNEPTQGAAQSGDVLLANVTFDVVLPANLPAGQSMFFELLDEVTGLALNPSRYRMEAGETPNHYSFKIPIPIGSLIKYRYGRDGGPVPLIEYAPNGKQVRYRLLKVDGPTTVNDIIAGWQDMPFSGPFGRLTGTVVDAKTKEPIPNIMVTAGGEQTLTAADGSYLLEGLPAGVHNLLAFSLDGNYQPFQQGAQVKQDMATNAILPLQPARLVNVTFITHPPADSARGIPIRMVGNILSMGNTFADLGGGISTIASRSPLMTLQSDGSYSLTLALPEGLDLRYKYSVGDGFWNAERNQQGGFYLRQFIVPDHDVTVQDTIDTWQTKNFGPVTFTVRVPDNTPVDDTVSIQFNPYGWTEPIPMWPLGDHQWLFILYSPLDLSSQVGYRFCRNDQCGMADDSATMGPDAVGKTFSPGSQAQNIQAEVKSWAWIPATVTPTTVVAGKVTPRGQQFVAGAELLPTYHPDWQPYISWGFDHIREMGAKWLVIDPTWTATRTNPPVIETVAGQDAYWQDLVQMIVWAQDKGLNIALFPTIDFSAASSDWWNSIQNNPAWWQSWFDRYRGFILNYADLAAQVRAGYLILGDPSVSPSLPGGTLPNGNPVDLTYQADVKWRDLIADVKARYSGKILWALSSTQGEPSLPGVAAELDGTYLLWTPSLSSAQDITTNALADEVGKQLDDNVKKLKDATQKPVILGVDYASINGAAKGCAEVDGNCLPFDQLTLNSVNTQITPDLTGQAVIYNALLLAINQRDWIDGLVTRGYNPPVVLEDFTSSVNGKPAGDMLWYWFSRMLASP